MSVLLFLTCELLRTVLALHYINKVIDFSENLFLLDHHYCHIDISSVYFWRPKKKYAFSAYCPFHPICFVI